MNPPSPPPGWYPDPGGPPGALRWWDGRQWTIHTHPPATEASEPPSAGLPPAERCEFDCPECGSHRVVPIVYGELNDALMRLSVQSKVRAGGAMRRLLSGDAPSWHCNRCNREWRGGLFRGGDGSTLDRAVLIHGAGCTAVGIRAEKQFLTERFGLKPSGWRQTNQRLVQAESGRCYDLISVALPGGSTSVVFFDVTEFFGKMP